MRLSAVILMASVCFGGCKRAPHHNGFAEATQAPPVVIPRLSRYWQIPDFELINQRGETFTGASMKGRFWVVDFFYSSCPGICPMLSSRLSDLHKLFEKESRLGFLSISTDPEKDTPENLTVYARKFGADARWFFLTGQKANIYKLALEGFKLALQETPGAAEPITHSSKLVLVDSEGWVRGFYEAVGEEESGASKRLLDDLHELLK